MVNRPSNWATMTPDEKGKWLRAQRHQPRQGIGGPHRKLTKKDCERVWGLIQTYENQTIVAEMLGVHRRTIARFLKRHPIPDTFKLEKNVEDYEEIQVWMKRQRGFSKQRTIDGYLTFIRQFHDWMREHYPERARPRLWTSDHILEWINGNEDIGWKGFEPYQQHTAITPLRQLANKCQKQFPLIDLGLLPTKRTHKAKRSLAGKPQWYFDIDPDEGINQVQAMINNVPAPSDEIEARNKCMIAWLLNTMVRTGDANEGLGLCGIKIEDLHLDEHQVTIKDKHSITWNVKGLSDETVAYARTYLALRGNPKEGFLFANEDGTPIRDTDVNKVIKEAGKNAGIPQYNKKTKEGKKLLAKTFRKTGVKYALEVLGLNPVSLVGTGKNIKTCFCVGWTDMKVLLEYYAPHLDKQIAKDRAKFTFNPDPEALRDKAKAEKIATALKGIGLDLANDKIMALVGVLDTIMG